MLMLGYTYTSLICGYGYECSDFNKSNRKIFIVVFSFVMRVPGNGWECPGK